MNQLRRALHVLAIAAFLSAGQAVAQEAAPSFRAGAEVGGAYLGGDGIADVSPFIEYAAARWSIGLGAPIRLRASDVAPTDTCKSPGLRCQDWDQKTDWARILRHLDIGDWHAAAHVHVGDLPGVTLGHGSLVWRYYNNHLFDTWRTGVYGHVDGKKSGFSLLIGDVWRADVMAARVWGRPFASGRWRGLEFGVQAALDRRNYRFDQSNGIVRGGGKELGGDLALQQVDSVGVDVGLEFVQSSRGVLATWMDTVVQVDRGIGVHLGLRGQLRGQVASAALSLEGRVASGKYQPAMLGPLYELTHAWTPRGLDGTAVAGGVRSSLEVVRSGWGRLVLAIDHQQGQKLDAYGWLLTDEWSGFSLRAFVGKRLRPQTIAAGGVDLGRDPVDWLGHVAARLRVQGPWYASLSAGRRWRVLDTWAPQTAPLYAETELRLAAGAEWRW